LEVYFVKPIADKMLIVSMLTALASTPTQAWQPGAMDRIGTSKTTAAESFVSLQRPPAPEVWSFRVEYRERRGPQFSWGKWHEYTTITGEYKTAKMRANNVADFIAGRSKNAQARIIETRLR
jgi:hypothetical protein